MDRCVLVRYDEIALKGQNRPVFERLLVDNIRGMLKKNGVIFKNVVRVRGRIIISSSDDCSCLRRVFGIASFSPAFIVEKSLDAITAGVLKLPVKGSFRVSVRRADKSFPLSSPELERNLGSLLEEKTGCKVKLKGFESHIRVEILSGGAYVFSESIQCFGGLPVSVEGSVVGLVRTPADILSCLLLMKRGCRVFPLGSIPSILESYSSEPLRSVQGVEEGVILGALGVVSGETLSVVAEEKYSDMFVLRPLIAYTPEEVLKEFEEYAKVLSSVHR